MDTSPLRVLKRAVPRRAWNLARGLQTLLPGTNRHWRSTGGTGSAAYCYEVFFKHLALAVRGGMRWPVPSVAEIGPGDSIGAGLAALLAGADRYHALDVVPYSLAERNPEILAELAEFLRARRPNRSWGWPNYDAALDPRGFPSAILGGAVLARGLAPARVGRIEAALRGAPSGAIRVGYHCPWTSSDALPARSVDWIWSQSVMEHVDDVEAAYASMHRWLRPGGFLTAQVDLGCHELYDRWNGHWGVSRWEWRVTRGRRAYLINRLPYTAHARLVRRHFEVRAELVLEDAGGIPDARFRPPFDALSPEERRTIGYFVVAVKR